MKGTGEYNPDFKEKALALKIKWHWRCERCGHIHDAEAGYALTVHHLDGDKSNDSDWNLACLCQRCHLSIQNRVFLSQYYMFEPSDWIKPHIDGYYKSLGAMAPGDIKVSSAAN